MDVIQTTQFIVTLVSPVAVTAILLNQIKAQQGVMDSMKSLFNMIDIDELEKFNERKTANAVSDAIENMDEHVLAEIRELLKHDIKSQKLAAKVWEDNAMTAKYVELLVGLCRLLKNLPSDKRERLIEKRFPQSSNEIRSIIDRLSN